MRLDPPPIWNEQDVKTAAKEILGNDVGDLSPFYPTEQEFRIFLPAHHEFCGILKRFRGRPQMPSKRGEHLIYPDRLAVLCATLKDEYGKTYVEIAEETGLPRTMPYESWQSDTVRYLVKRGRRLINSLDNNV